MAALGWLGFVTAGIIGAAEVRPSARADAAIVLGAAVYGAKPSPVFAERLNHAVSLYGSGRVKLLVLTGGKGEGARFSESAVAKRYLQARGVPARAMLTEERSHTTRQNLVEARRLLSDKPISTLLIVSDPLHMRRALAMAGDLDLPAEGSPTPTSRYRSWSAKLPFLLRELYFLHHYWLFGA